MKVLIKPFLVWLLLIPLAIANGILREFVLVPAIGWYGLPLSGIILSVLIVLVAYFCAPALGLRAAGDALRIGLFWVILTIAFEFSFGLSSGTSLDALLAAYNPATGNLWLVVIVATGLAPFLAAKARRIL